MSCLNHDLLLGNETSKIIFTEIKNLPVYDIHTHVDLKMVLDNKQAPDPWTALCKGDHYVSSIIESLGEMDRVTLYSEKTDPYDKWYAYAKTFPKLLGVQIQEWMRLTLSSLGVEQPFHAENAKRIWDQLSQTISADKYRPVSLFKNSNIKLMSTTNNPVEDLDLITRSEKIFGKGYWMPAWRPDVFFNLMPGSIKSKTWLGWLNDLESTVSLDLKGNFKAFLSALAKRHDFFAQKGCRASDYGVTIPYGHDVSETRATSIFKKACKNEPINETEAADFQAYLTRFSMDLDYEKGWISQIHYGAVRNMRDIASQYGGLDSGCDTVGGYAQVAQALRPLLNHFDSAGKKQHKIFLYTLDKADWMKIAGLSRIFPSTYAGVSWWYFDSVSGMLEFFRTVPDAGAGLCKTGPFVTDARNIYSLGPRSQVYRRCLATILGELVEFRKNSLEEALSLAKYLCGDHIKNLLGI